MRLLFLLAFALAAQEALTNEGVVKLIKAGLSEDLVISAIADQPGNFVLGATELVALKEGGVSEKVIRAMMAKGKPGAASLDALRPSPATAAKSDMRSVEAPISALAPGSVYYKKGADYFELLTEEIRWKTSGAMKSFASAGIIKNTPTVTSASVTINRIIRKGFWFKDCSCIGPPMVLR